MIQNRSLSKTRTPRHGPGTEREPPADVVAVGGQHHPCAREEGHIQEKPRRSAHRGRRGRKGQGGRPKVSNITKIDPSSVNGHPCFTP